MRTEPLVILLAEDDDGHAQLIRRNLKRAGVANEVVHVTDGQYALDFLARRGAYADRVGDPPLLLLLDINMPRVNGVDVLKAIKADPVTAGLPVIMLTTTDDPREVDKCYQLGCSVYITKPVKYDEFSEALNRLGLFLEIIQVPTPRTAPEQTGTMTPDRPETVLILEDDEGVARLQQRRLERAGYTVAVTATAEEALARIHEGGLDLLLFDHRLSPTEDGLGLYTRLRAEGCDLPVILVTGYSDDATVVRALRAGVRDYVFKSAEYLDYLPEAVGRVLKQVRDGRERDRAVVALRAKSDELKITTRQLWQAARLAGVGELAASIAHELNNPLGTVSLRIEGVLSKTPPDDPRRKALEVIDQEIARMARLVGNLLQFSRAGRDQVSTVDVGDELGKTIELTEHHLTRHGIRIELDFGPGVPVIFADRQHLRQVFLNLITNAADAMPGGGRLTVRTRAEVLNGIPAVVIEVKDTGIGIPPELLARVTDPFFTTKEEGKGTGLGLAICKRIVSQHVGRLEIESTVGTGTTIRVVLPVRNDANVSGLGPN